jgi:hypothetical protein
MKILDFPRTLGGFRIGDFLTVEELALLEEDGPSEEGSQDYSSIGYPRLSLSTYHSMVVSITARDECWCQGSNLIGAPTLEVAESIGSRIATTEELGDGFCHFLENGLEIWEFDARVTLIGWSDWDLIPD